MQWISFSDDTTARYRSYSYVAFCPKKFLFNMALAKLWANSFVPIGDSPTPTPDFEALSHIVLITLMSHYSHYIEVVLIVMVRIYVNS